jgi:hypothetical protein
VILLDSAQIVAAVRRSLESHVLPELTDEFARLQVLAAFKALDEVHDRLANGDPCVRQNDRLESELADVAGELAETHAAAAERLREILAELPDTAEPRDRTRALGSAVTAFLADADGPVRARVLTTLQDHAARTAGEDAMWMCREAIESLQ